MKVTCLLKVMPPQFLVCPPRIEGLYANIEPILNQNRLKFRTGDLLANFENILMMILINLINSHRHPKF